VLGLTLGAVGASVVGIFGWFLEARRTGRDTKVG
jgi:hypothetical protein